MPPRSSSACSTASGRREIERIALPEYTDEVWHGYLPEARPGQLYGYRVHGPYEPAAGHRFNPNKLLIDPYAKALLGAAALVRRPFRLPRRQPARGPVVRPPRQRPRHAEMPSWSTRPSPGATTGRRDVPWRETVIYEAHVRGFTDAPSGRAGAAARHLRRARRRRAVIDHLLKLGVTAIELLPVHAFVDDRHLVEQGLRNYWGYNTIGFFAPEPRYVSPAAPSASSRRWSSACTRPASR